MKKSTVRLIIFASIIAAIFIAAFVCFAISKGIKVTFDENTVALQGAIAAGDDALAGACRGIRGRGAGGGVCRAARGGRGPGRAGAADRPM